MLKLHVLLVVYLQLQFSRDYGSSAVEQLQDLQEITQLCCDTGKLHIRSNMTDCSAVALPDVPTGLTDMCTFTTNACCMDFLENKRRCDAGIAVASDIDGCDSLKQLAEVAENRCKHNICEHQCDDNGVEVKCSCRRGYELISDGKSCQDIDECATGQHNCIRGAQRCDNTIGSFRCIRTLSCGTGYTLQDTTGICEDIDECGLGTHDCDRAGSEYICVNIPGAFNCEKHKSTPNIETVYDESEENDLEENKTTITNIGQPQPITTTTLRPEPSNENQVTTSRYIPTEKPAEPIQDTATTHKTPEINVKDNEIDSGFESNNGELNPTQPTDDAAPTQTPSYVYDPILPLPEIPNYPNSSRDSEITETPDTKYNTVLKIDITDNSSPTTIYLPEGQETATVKAEKTDESAVVVDTQDVPKNAWTNINNRSMDCPPGFEMDDYGVCFVSPTDVPSTTTTSPDGLERFTENTHDELENPEEKEDEVGGSKGSGFPDRVDSGYKEKIVRVSFVVMEPYLQNYSNRDSVQFQHFSKSLVDAVNLLYEGLPGTHRASLTRIQSRIRAKFSCKVTLDIVTTYEDTNRIAQILQDHIRNRMFLGNIMVSANSFKAVEIEPEIVRVTFVVLEPYSQNYSNRDSVQFQHFSKSLVDAVNLLYEGLPGTHRASLMRIQSSINDEFSCKVTLDIMTTYGDTNRIAQILQDHIRNRMPLGNLMVSADGFKAVDIDPDIDECATSRHHCSGITEVCRNIMGGYICDCAIGFRRNIASGSCDLIAITPFASSTPEVQPPPPPEINPLFPETTTSPTPTTPPSPPPPPSTTPPSPTTTPPPPPTTPPPPPTTPPPPPTTLPPPPPTTLPPPPTTPPPPPPTTTLPPPPTTPPPPPTTPPPPPTTSTETHSNCGAGFHYNSQSRTCEDIDECATGEARCGSDQICVNSRGGYTCRCPPGHRLTADHVCEDVDECALARNRPTCSRNADCINTIGSYKCVCHSGFISAPANDKICIDLDECVEARPGSLCQHRCNNIWGSYRCSCYRGYRLNSDNRTCSDVDECEEYKSKRLCIGYCQNEPGSYRCTCPSGYRLSGDKKSCTDINECETGEAPCANSDVSTVGSNEVCVNTRGGYRCQRITCLPGYLLENRLRCKIIKHYCQSTDWDCIHQPTVYSYNFITFVSNLDIPDGQVHLFTMRGPRWTNARMKFSLRLVSVNAPPTVKEKADFNAFLLVQTSNKAIVSLTKSLIGPQNIELELSMEFYDRDLFGGIAVAKMFIFVSEHEF